MIEKEFDFLRGEVLLVDKPIGWTSFDVVNSIRYAIKRSFNIKKIKVGHAGTLDPLATGLLIVCTGKFTKQIDAFQGQNKTYIGSMVMGATTPSFDMETDIDQRFDISGLTQKNLKETCLTFTGEIEQVPPVYSAVKVDGKRAFLYARTDSEVKLKTRIIRINKFELLNTTLPKLDFIVECSKGTYIRSLVSDFGKRLDNGAYLSALRRTEIGSFSVNDALSIDELKKNIFEAGERSILNTLSGQ